MNKRDIGLMAGTAVVTAWLTAGAVELTQDGPRAVLIWLLLHGWFVLAFIAWNGPPDMRREFRWWVLAASVAIAFLSGFNRIWGGR
jgi:hypothetical protein